ncbi:MAG: hypothetical protein P1V97_00535 [Planctomycetota bacterium]|nr:hypothetical protein [Planctomycetota bacterium]
MGPWRKIQRGATVGLLGLGMIAFGLVLLGRDGEALRAFERLTGPEFVLSPLPGSESEPVRLAQTSHGPEWIQMCRSSKSVSQIVADYEKVAARDSMQLSRSLAPYIKHEAGHLGMITWIDHKGRRLGVVAFPIVDGRSSRYVLFQAGVMAAESKSTPVLPLGVQAPPGTRTLFDIRRHEQNMSYCQVPGSPANVLADMEKRLQSAGCTVDQQSNRILATRAQGQQMVALRFEKDDQVGFLTVKMGKEPGCTDVSLITRKK